MKKMIVIAALLFVCAGLYAQDQNLRNIPDYQEGLRYQSLARQAYDDGDYDQSVEYSATAQEFFQKARDYADKRALRFTATNLRNRAKDRLQYAQNIHAERDYPVEFAAATTLNIAANEAYAAEGYGESITGFQAVLDTLKSVVPLVPEPKNELAKADELRGIVANYGLRSFRPTETLRGDTAYDQGKGFIGNDNAQAKLMLTEAIKQYEGVINAGIAFRANQRRAELAEAKKNADAVKADVLAADAYNEARQMERSAESNLSARNVLQAWDDSEKALAAYKRSYEIASAADAKPEYYTVRLIPHRRDCFWRIAGYDFVYGDPWKWRLLYDANKNLIPDPNNPRLIEPGTRIRIPSLEGEVRAGDYPPK